jgi:hypothetical protein
MLRLRVDAILKGMGYNRNQQNTLDFEPEGSAFNSPNARCSVQALKMIQRGKSKHLPWPTKVRTNLGNSKPRVFF